MKTHVDDRLRAEAARFSLRHRCDDCVHWNEHGEDSTCASEWPTHEHRLPLARADIIVFCKEFEAG